MTDDIGRPDDKFPTTNTSFEKDNELTLNAHDETLFQEKSSGLADPALSDSLKRSETRNNSKWKIWKKRNGISNTDPQKFSPLKKNLILLIVALASSISPISTTIYYPALVPMQLAFHTTDTAMNASLSIFTFFTAFFPLLWASFGDVYGRRIIYLTSFLISVVGNVCCALSVNITMFIVFRAVSAIGSSSVMSMGAGTLADIFEPKERGRAFALYTCGPLLGPAIGPIVGGYLNEGLGWQSNFWLVAIFGFMIWLAILLFLPETWRAAPALPTTSVVEQTKKKSPRWHVNPLSALKLFRYLNISLTVLFISMLFLVFYLVNTLFTRTYTIQYGMDSGTVGLCYLPMAAGAMSGSNIGGRISDRVYNRRVKQANGEAVPEMRISFVIIGICLFIQMAAFTAYGWCVQKNVHFAYGLVCLFFVALGLMVPLVTVSTYIVDCFRRRSASVTACNNFGRYLTAGIGALVASDLQRALGDGILFTVCGALVIVSTSALVYVKSHTQQWIEQRKNSAE